MDLKLWCDNCIKFQLFEGAQNIFIRLTAVCWMLQPHNPHRLPQQYKRDMCGPSCSCKHRFWWISLISEHLFCLNYIGAVCHWQTFWSTATVCFIGQRWYYNPQWTPLQAIIKAWSVSTSLVSWEKCAVTVCLHIYISVCGGVSEVEGYILAAEWKPDLQGSCSIASHSNSLNRRQQNSLKLWQTVCDISISCSAT